MQILTPFSDMQPLGADETLNEEMVRRLASTIEAVDVSDAGQVARFVAEAESLYHQSIFWAECQLADWTDGEVYALEYTTALHKYALDERIQAVVDNPSLTGDEALMGSLAADELQSIIKEAELDERQMALACGYLVRSRLLSAAPGDALWAELEIRERAEHWTNVELVAFQLADAGRLEVSDFYSYETTTSRGSGGTYAERAGLNEDALAIRGDFYGRSAMAWGEAIRSAVAAADAIQVDEINQAAGPVQRAGDGILRLKGGKFRVHLRDMEEEMPTRMPMSAEIGPEQASTEELWENLNAIKHRLNHKDPKAHDIYESPQMFAATAAHLTTRALNLPETEAGLQRTHLTVDELMALDDHQFEAYRRAVDELFIPLMEGLIFNRKEYLAELTGSYGWQQGAQALMEAMMLRDGLELSPLSVTQARQLTAEQLDGQMLELARFLKRPFPLWRENAGQGRADSLAREKMRRELRKSCPPEVRYAMMKKPADEPEENRSPFAPKDESGEDIGLLKFTVFTSFDAEKNQVARIQAPDVEFPYLDSFVSRQLDTPGLPPQINIFDGSIEDEKLSAWFIDLHPFGSFPEPTEQDRAALETVHLDPISDAQGVQYETSELYELFVELFDKAQSAGPGAMVLALPRLDSIMRWQLIDGVNSRSDRPPEAAWAAFVLYPIERSQQVLGAEPGFGVKSIAWLDENLGVLQAPFEHDYPSVRQSPDIFDRPASEEETGLQVQPGQVMLLGLNHPES